MLQARFPSSRDPATVYVAWVDPETGDSGCHCPGNRSGHAKAGHCRHIGAVLQADAARVAAMVAGPGDGQGSCYQTRLRVADEARTAVLREAGAVDS